MTADGVIAVSAAPNRWWAWAALRLAPAGATRSVGADTPGPATAARQGGGDGSGHINLFDGNAEKVVQLRDLYGNLVVQVADGRPVAPGDDGPWLRSVWRMATASAARVDIRYGNDPGTSELCCFLIVRVEAADRGSAVDTAARLRARLAELPERLRGVRVTADAELPRILEPLRPHPQGLVEIRKRLTVARSTRGDAASPWLAAVTPLRGGDRGWEPLWAELARLPFRAVLAVGLTPYQIGAGLRAHLANRATEFGRLAAAGPPPTGTWGVVRPPDQFAVAAAPLWHEAVARYTDQAFQFRVTLAAEKPIPDALAELVADTISPTAPGSGFAGAPPMVVRPAPDELTTAWRNVAELNFHPLAAHLAGFAPSAVGDVARRIGDILDITEAAAVFRLPYATSGRSSLFRPVGATADG